jgi:anthranilate synthase/aminodeoxychorismate synthase-like glutamine amidotransferase
MILLIDNYDSFTYNLYQYLSELGALVEVFRNDRISIAEIERMAPARIVISPGPGRPEDGGVSLECIEKLGPRIPLLGVCLGHQCIGQAFGGKVVSAPRLMHGKTSGIAHDGKGLFKGVENPFTATRYHSLIVDEKSLPDCFEITARTQEGELMGLRHKKHPIEGIQFHPESILTPAGKAILKNFIGS